MSLENISLILSSLALVGFLSQWVSWKVQVPSILLLLLLGLFLGPFLNILQPDLLFGDLLFPVVSLSVAIILFEGSLTLNFKELKGAGQTVRSMVSWGAIISWILTSCATHYILNFSWSLAILFGSLTVVTGPTVIVPLLKTVKPQSNLAKILRWEGILIDPIGALFVVIIYEFIMSSSELHSLKVFSIIIMIGVFMGIISGIILAHILRKNYLPEYLHSFAVLTFVLMVFSLSNMIENEAGLLSVTILGMWLANSKEVDIKHILHFKENLTILLISGLFLILASRIQLSDFSTLGWNALFVLICIQFISRPLSIFISTIKSSLNFKEKLFLSWVAPRGIVAAAISALFSIKLVSIQVENAELIVPLTFLVIIGTVVLQSITARPIAKLLGVAEPSPHGFLVIGANEFARMLALAIKKYDYKVILTDSNWDYIRDARMAGFETYYGNPTSSHADEYLNLIGIGSAISVTSDEHFNLIASNKFIDNFSKNNVFALIEKKELSEYKNKHKSASQYRGQFMLNNLSYQKILTAIKKGAAIRHTKISETFTVENYLQNYVNKVIPLFIVDKENNIKILGLNDILTTEPGSTIVALINDK